MSRDIPPFPPCESMECYGETFTSIVETLFLISSGNNKFMCLKARFPLSSSCKFCCNLISKSKVKFALEQAMKAQRGNRSITLLFIMGLGG